MYSIKFRKVLKNTVFIFLMMSSIFFINAIGGSKDLIVSIAQLPGLSETPDKGAFIDLAKAIDDVYKEGSIKIEVYPFPRSIDNVITGKADFHIPIFENPEIPVSKLPFRYISERIGKTAFVLYSHVDKPITKKMIDDALAKGGDFPYKLDIGNGVETSFNFPLTPTAEIDQSFRKIASKRIDGMIWAQDEADIVLKKLKIKNIYRTHLKDFEDTLLIQKGPEGDKVDAILSAAIKELRKSGRLKVLWEKVHLPYDDWQPSKMGW